MKRTGLFRGRKSAAMVLAAMLLVSAWCLANAELGGMNTGVTGITILTRYYGIPSEEIERIITVPLEESVSGLAGIKEFKSCSEFSLSRIELSLATSADTGRFLIELRDRIDRCYAWILQSSPAVQKPRIFNSGSGQQAIFIAAFSRGNRSPEEIRQKVEEEVEPSYSRIEGLGEIEISGGALPEIHILIDPDRAAALGFSSDSAASLIRSSNIYSNAGFLDNGKNRLPLSLEARLNSLDKLGELPVSREVQLSSIAGIVSAYREADKISRFNNREMISLHIKSSSNNLISISRQLREKTSEWQKKGWEAEIIYDRGAELERGLMQITIALGIGMFASTVLMIFFRLDKYRLIILFLTQPAILLFSLGLLSALGFSPDRWLFAGLTVGIGMILDSALVTTECLRLTGGAVPAVKPLLASTLSTLAALLPVISLTEEIPGLRQLLAAVSVMLSASLIISLVFLPPFFKGAVKRPSGNFIFILAGLRRRLLSLTAGAVSASYIVCKNRRILAAAALLPLAGIISLAGLPIQLSTPADSPVIFARIELEEGESLKSSDLKIKRLCGELCAEESVVSVQSTAGRGGGHIAVRFIEKKITRNSMTELIKSSGKSIPGGFIYIPEGDSSEFMKLTVSVSGAETERLKSISREALRNILATDWAVEGVLHFKEDPPAVHYIPDSKSIAAAGITISAAAALLRWNLQGPVADKWFIEGRERDLRVMAANNTKLDTGGLSSLKFPQADSNTAPRLDQLGAFTRTTDASRIHRVNRRRSESFTVSCRNTDPVELNDMIWKELDRIELPQGYSFAPSSQLIERQELYKKMWLRFILAIVLIFFILSIGRESLKQAGLVLLQLPFILAVPMIVIRITGRELGTETILGLILVSGLGINNGILIIDNLEYGVFQAVKKRFNGLFLTTGTTVAGLIPMVFTSAPFFRNLSAVLISGLTASFFISIWLFPLLLMMPGLSVCRCGCRHSMLT